MNEDNIMDQSTEEINADMFSNEWADELSEDTDFETESEQDQPESESDEKKAAESEDANKEQPQNQQFVLKHLGNERTVGYDEVITLAQKGQDYDRIKTKLEEAGRELSENRDRLSKFDEYETFLTELAQTQNLTVEQLIDNTKVAVIAKRDGIDENTARAKLAIEKERKALEEDRKKLKSDHGGQPDKEQQRVEFDKRRDEDIKRFLEEYKDIKPDDIPKTVWEEVGKGSSLLDAYTRYENKTLKEQLQAAKKNEENRRRAPSSQRSAGKQRSQDPYLKDWYSGD